MFFKFFVLIFSSFTSDVAFAVNQPVKTEVEALFDYRNDRIRSDVNTNTTAIRNFSVRVSKETDENSFLIELLGDEGLSTENVDLSIGEFYYTFTKDLKFFTPDVKAGIFKLEYGKLNHIDDHFYRLPSYYQFLYGLPRGIDTGIYVDNRVLGTDLYFGGGAYLGKALRGRDLKRREAFGTPFSTHVRYQFREQTSLKFNYFVREYEDSPKVSGWGLSYSDFYTFKKVSLALMSELYFLNAATRDSSSDADAFMISPKLSYAKFYFQSLHSYESWGAGGFSAATSNSEYYQSLRFGFLITEHLTFEAEHLKIEDRKESFTKEEQFLARVYMNWTF